MSNTIQTYQDLITSEYQGQPNFLATIAANVATQVQVQSLLQSMLPLFDLDTPPVGDQLDIIGQWVGISREVTDPPIEPVYFTWDGTPSEGYDYSVWAPEGMPSTITILSDAAYLNLILAKIAANQWNGTTEGAYAIWERVFPDNTLLIQDNEDMSYDMILLGFFTAETLGLLTGGYIQLKPEGVAITGYFVGPTPLFAWNVDTPKLQGWGTGFWAAQIAPGV